MCVTRWLLSGIEEAVLEWHPSQVPSQGMETSSCKAWHLCLLSCCCHGQWHYLTLVRPHPSQGYLPTNAARQAGVVARKRAEYMTLKERHYGKNRVYRTEKDDKTLRDVLVDLPRTCPGMALVHTDFVQRSLERVLYVAVCACTCISAATCD